MLRLPRRQIALLCISLFLPQISGCLPTRTKRQVEPPASKVKSSDRILSVAKHDGTLISFDSKLPSYAFGDTIFAFVNKDSVAIPMAEVQRVWVSRINTVNSLINVITVAVVVLGVLLAIAVATKESCPFIYSWDGEKYVFDAEPYGGAVTRGLERDDYSELEHLRPDSAGLYRLQVTNEVNETQYTNSMRLLVVDHAPGSRVVMDEWGSVHAMTKVYEPTSALDRFDRDLLMWLRAADGRIWEPNAAEDDSGNVRQEIVLTFPKPAGASHAKLVVRVSTGLWGSHMIREFLQLRGVAVEEWYDAIDNIGPAQDMLRAWNVREELYVLKLEIQEAGGWTVRGLVPGGGPFIAEDRVVPLDLSKVAGDSVRVRIRPPSGFWALNSFGMSYDRNSIFTVDTIAPQSAVTSHGQDILPVLAAGDTTYYTMPNIGDVGYVTFPAPAQRPGMTRTVVLHSRGYYRLHLPAGGAPDLAALQRITDVPDAAARLAAESFSRRRVAGAP